MNEVPKDPRLRMYYPIVMPVDKFGHGPADLVYAVKLTWEVWDQYLMSFGSYDYLQDAIAQAEKLNHEYHVLGITREHQHAPNGIR